MNNENLYILCSKFDTFTILDSKSDFSSYYAKSATIYSDGDVEKNISHNGLIHITSVKNASYLIFLDRNDKINLYIYKYTEYNIFNRVINELKAFKKELHLNNENDIKDNLIDINNFKCIQCSNKIKFRRSNKYLDIIEGVCIKCGTVYSFKPSKFYTMVSKKIIYNKNKNSRNIIFEENNKTYKEEDKNEKR